MKIKFLLVLSNLLLFLYPNAGFSQAPSLGTTSTFSVFTAVGAFSVDGATNVSGDVGTNAGAFSGFPPGVLVGQKHVADAISAIAATDVSNAYTSFPGGGAVIGVTLGNGQIITPGVYSIGAAATLNGVLTFNGSSTDLFIIQINGALSTNSNSSINITGGASACNVFWRVNGAFALGTNSSFQGTVVASGAITLNSGSSLSGRALTTAGAVNLHSTNVSVPPPPTANISASGSTNICQGSSVTLTATTADSYSWSNGETTKSIGVSTAGNYSVTVTTACGTTTSVPTVVTVSPIPTASISANGPLTFCQGGSVVLTASGGGTYQWSTGATTTSITVSASGNYTVTATNAAGCSGTSAATTVTVNPNPIASVSAGGPTTFCQGGSVVLTASGGSTYLWSNGATTPSITVSSSGNYSVIATNASGCSGTSTATSVTVNLIPTPSISANGPITFCQGGSVVLTASGGSTYLWSNGATTASITVVTSGTYSVIATNAAGCKGTSAGTIVTVNPNPTATISANGPLIFCQGGSVVLTASLGSGYLWSTGATTQNITVSTSGNYTVAVTNANACQSTSAATLVTVNPSAIPTISASGPLTFCTGGSVTLNSSVASGYLWSTGATTQSITVNAAGSYSVTTSGTCGGTSVPAIITISPSSIPTISASGPLTFCPGGSVILTSSGASGYLWSTGATTQSITVSAAGSYSVTTTGACAGTSLATVVTTSASGVPTISANGPLTFCQGGSVMLTSSSASGYLWNNGATTQSITVTTAGNYSVTTSGICAGTSAAIAITVIPILIPTITANGPLTFCQGGSVLLTSSASSGNLWSTGATTQSITVTTAGNYSVTTTANCGGTSTPVTVNVSPIIIPTISANGPLTFCPAGSVILTSSIANSYLWSTGATTQSITVNTAGSYTVTATGTCAGTSAAALVTISPSAIPVITASGPLTFCPGGSVILTSTGASGYLWSTGATTQSITVTAVGSYSVTTTGACAGASAATVVTINPASIPTITASGPLTFCQGGSILLTSSASGGYLWSTGATTQSITVTASGNYSVTTSGSCGGTSVATPVTVTPLLVPTITASGPLGFCQGDSVILTASSSSEYLWSTGATTRNITVKAAGSYSVTATSICGGTSVPAIITLNATINPTISASGPLLFCPGDSVILTSSTASKYKWSTGDTTASIKVKTGGSYTVTTSGICAVASSAVLVIINPVTTPTIALSGSPALCQGDSIVLTSSAGNGYLWSTGDTTQSIIVKTAGNYTVKTTGFCGSVSAATAITVNNSEIPTITASGRLAFCPNDSVVLTSSSSGKYKWSTGDTTQKIIVKSAGSYTVTTPGLCAGVSASTIVSINSVVIPTITVTGRLNFCTGDSVILTSSQDSGNLWSTGDTLRSIIVRNGGIYTVLATNVCSDTSLPVIVNVSVDTLPVITTSGPTTFCQGDQVILSASKGDRYFWSFGGKSRTVSVSTSGTYWVSVTNVCGTKTTSRLKVVVNPIPDCTIIATSPLCELSSTTLCVSASNAKYLWSTGDTTQCISPGKAGTYSVTVIGVGGCSSTCSKTLIADKFPDCTISGVTVLCPMQTSILSAPGGDATYQWNTGATTQSIAMWDAGTYTVTVTNANGCASTCSKVVSVASSDCLISGNLNICAGETTELKGPMDAKTYLWSTGSTAGWITVSEPGIYSLTATSAEGCVSHCSRVVTSQGCIACLPGYGSFVPDYSSIYQQKSDSKNKVAILNVSNEKVTLTAGSMHAQAYPNPFVRSTMIEFSSPVNQTVSVDIYNLQGQKVASLFKGMMARNERRQVRFDATNLNEGIYFYRINEEKSSISRKLVLMKN